MSNAGQPADDLEAVRTISETLKKFAEEDQARILRWVQEKLGMVMSRALPLDQAPSSASMATGPIPDIRNFVQLKNPKNDVQFAATVAYFYAFEAAASQRRPEIDATGLQDATRQAGRDRLNQPSMTLNNAVKLG